jgi:hypothetical protein
MMRLSNKFTIVSVFIILLLLTSCKKFVHTRDELILYVDNKLERNFVCLIETNVGEKLLHLKNNEGDSLIFVNEQMVETSIFGLSELNDEQMVILLETGLYNISDTTYFKWTEIRENEYEKEIYYEHLSTTHKENSHLNYTSYRNLTIDSTLLPIFKKDYGMLELFKEYYKAEE